MTRPTDCGRVVHFETRNKGENMIVTVSWRTYSTLNVREHWAVRSKRMKAERELGHALAKPQGFPCIVSLTRIAPRPLDSDNLAASFKAIRDGVADRLKIKDNDPRVTWVYHQRKGKPHEYAIQIAIEPLSPVLEVAA